MAAALLSAALLLLLLPAAAAQNPIESPITILVSNSLTSGPDVSFSTYVVFRGVLLGGMRRLTESDAGFTFSYTEDMNYGPLLVSVNGLAGCATDRTFWELKVQKPDGQIIRPDVGIGCYIPIAGDVIILNFKTY